MMVATNLKTVSGQHDTNKPIIEEFLKLDNKIKTGSHSGEGYAETLSFPESNLIHL